MILKQYIESWGRQQNHHRDQKNLPVQKVRMKWMFILSILDNQGEPKINWAWMKNSEQWELYMQVLEKLFKNGSWFLLHDNSPPHSAMTVKHFHVNCGTMENGQSPKETDLHPVTFLWFPTVKTTFKEYPRHWGPQKQENSQIKCCSFGCLWGMFCASFRKVYEMCCSQGRLLQRKIKECLSYCICICSTDQVQELYYSMLYV